MGGANQTNPNAKLRNLLEKTAFSMAQQDVRYFLNGVLLELDGAELAAVATDGHRLARSHTSLPAAVDNPRQAIVPRKAVHELVRFLRDTEEPITLEMNPSHLRFSRPGAALTTKIIDGKFPDYRSVMTQNLTQTVIAERSELYDVLARAAVLTNEKYRGIRLELDQGSAKVVAHNPDQEEARDEIAVEYSGEAIEIGFNVTYLMEALRALTENKVEIQYKMAIAVVFCNHQATKPRSISLCPCGSNKTKTQPKTRQQPSAGQ